MSVQRKMFRVEALMRSGNGVAMRSGNGRAGHAAEPILMAETNRSHHEIMTELKALRALIRPQDELAHVVESYKHEIVEAQKLKRELDIIYEAINKTKKEIATLHVAGFEGPEMKRVTHELDAVVDGTEKATENILAAAEFIDQAAGSLGAALKSEHEKQLAHDIQDQVIQIFEACNFQDLTGQRITKVVATLKFIETHIVRMMEIWGGIDSFKDVEAEAREVRDGDQKLINGPKLNGEVGHASQDDIDALFN